MTREEYDKRLNQISKKKAELDIVYYDDSQEFDGDSIVQLHLLLNEALSLAEALAGYDE